MYNVDWHTHFIWNCTWVPSHLLQRHWKVFPEKNIHMYFQVVSHFQNAKYTTKHTILYGNKKLHMHIRHWVMVYKLPISLLSCAALSKNRTRDGSNVALATNSPSPLFFPKYTCTLYMCRWMQMCMYVNTWLMSGHQIQYNTCIAETVLHAAQEQCYSHRDKNTEW